MNPALLVALREYRQIIATRGFRVMLLGLPLLIAISVFGSRSLAPSATTASYVMVDATARFAPAIAHRVERDHQRQLMMDLSAFTKRALPASPDPGWFSDADVERFIAEGGVPAALRKIAPQLPAGTASFKPSPEPYLLTPPPPEVPTDQGPARFGAAMKPWLQDGIVTPQGKRPLALAVYIPKDFGQGDAAVRIWTNGGSSDGLIDMIESQLTRTAQLRALQARGVDADAAARIEDFSPALQVINPPSGEGRARVIIRSAVPLALVYILLMAAMITGQMILQGVIEERSNKLLEAVLACIRPSELMMGKLLGLGAIGLTLMAVWIGCALAAAFAVSGPVADFLQPALASVDQPWMIIALLFYFLAGYLILAMIFLTIGSLSNSMQDASAYMMPVVMVVMLPIIIMVTSALRNPDGLFPHILSWIPIYTPFAMLARLGSGVSVTEIIGTGVLLVGFVALEITLLGRIFQASLLHTGQPPKFAALVKLVLQKR